MILDMPQDIEVTLKSLKSNHFDARFAQTRAEARRLMLEMIPPTCSVGIGDSVTLRQIGIIEALIQRGNEVINPFTRELSQGTAEKPANRTLFQQMQRRIFSSDVFLTSSNALTRDGKIVSVDYAGNRVAGMIFGSNKIILPIGRNKIVPDVDSALKRIKDVLAPVHARQKEIKTPCAITGKCIDCDSPGRICNVTIILEKKPGPIDYSIILINEDLGLGWDPAWDEKRISAIRSDYSQNTWTFFKSK